MSVYQSPVGLAAAPVANQLTELLTFKEDLCNPVCVINPTQPSAFVEFSNGTPVLNGNTVFIPVIAKITILSPSCGCKAVPQVITERFQVAFTGQTAVPTAVTITSDGMVQNVSCVDKRGCAHGYVINNTITVAITPPAAAAALSK